MRRRQRHFARLLVFSFMVRALVPVGLMLQLPSALADSGIAFGFILCPSQNPAINFDIFSENSAGENHSHHHHDVQSVSGVDSDSPTTVSLDHSSTSCHLWTNSAEVNAPLSVAVSGINCRTQDISRQAEEGFASNTLYRSAYPRAPPLLLI